MASARSSSCRSAGRNVWSLASTTPGVLGGLNSDIGLSFRGAGQREIQNSLSLDGISSSSNLLAATSMRPIADAVTEIQVQTGSTSAEYGSYLGVHINVVTKSGTNSTHGTLFYFGQDDSLDSRGYFENPAIPKNPRNRKQFGAPGGRTIRHPGPVRRPQQDVFHGRLRGRARRAITSPIASVPTPLMRQGNFSEITTAIRNPFTGQNFPGNVIPPQMLSPDVARCCCSTIRRRISPAPPTTIRARARTPTTWIRSWRASIRTWATWSG